MKGKWQGIPGEWVDDPTAIDGRRFVASAHGVRLLRARMAQERQGRCEECSGMGTDRHHVYGRGFGGGKTEDRPSVNGVKFVRWLCRRCHDVQVIRGWGSWRDCAVEPVPQGSQDRTTTGQESVLGAGLL